MDKPETLTESEQDALLDQPNPCYPVDLRNLAVLQLTLKHGLRFAEQLALRWTHIDLSAKTIFINGSNGIRARVIQLIKPSQRTLDQWKQCQKKEWTKRTPSCAPRDRPVYVFRRLEGSRIPRRYLQRMVTVHAEEAGLDGNVTVKTLRRTFAWNLYDRSKNIRQVQNALGHKELATTLMFTGLNPSHLGIRPPSKRRPVPS